MQQPINGSYNVSVRRPSEAEPRLYEVLAQSVSFITTTRNTRISRLIACYFQLDCKTSYSPRMRRVKVEGQSVDHHGVKIDQAKLSCYFFQPTDTKDNLTNHFE